MALVKRISQRCAMCTMPTVLLTAWPDDPCCCFLMWYCSVIVPSRMRCSYGINAAACCYKHSAARWLWRQQAAQV
jgi:hypothetical protein